MKKINADIFGGAQVRRSKARHKIPIIIGVTILTLILYSSSALAQGSIFGTVTNSNTSTPANGEVSFFGFLDDTDEEIRIETCIGAGYDAGNWFDDFQNYLTEAPGNPYDYYFYNATNGEGATLSKTIPNNSFQQEDIQLIPVDWPMAVTGLSSRVISSTSIMISWNGSAGMTYHVYRRMASSNGSFFRVDDPSGSLANPGVATDYFVDNTVDGISSYHYLIIARDASGNFGPHSAILTGNSSGSPVAPLLTGVTPPSGSYVGGMTVTIEGIGFDPAGVTVDFGGSPLASITSIAGDAVVGVTPPGTPGSIDIIVTNNASGLVSTPLTGGFTYDANSIPVIAPIGPQVVTEAEVVTINVSASDADGAIPTLFTSTPLPTGATFIDNGDGTGLFDWPTTYSDAGLYQVTFYATDDIDTASEVVDITINEAGNQAPILDPIGPLQVYEADTLVYNVTATDLDGDILQLFADSLPTNASFVDSGNGVGTFVFMPDTLQEGFYDIYFYVTDGQVDDSEIVTVEVLNLENRPPAIVSVADTTINESDSLMIVVTATDPEGSDVSLAATSNIGTFSFVDSGNGVGVFSYGSDFYSSGTYSIWFTATDTDPQPRTEYDTVNVTVADVNQAPIMDSISTVAGVSIGDTLVINISATDDTDPDPTAFLTMSHTGLPANATFVDNGDNTADFTFAPDSTQIGVVSVTFVAADTDIPSLSDQITVDISVVQENRWPEITVDPYAIVAEGGHLEMPISATDPDGNTPAIWIDKNPENSSFVDNGDGTGLFVFDPGYTQSGLDRYEVRASDGFVVVKKNVLIQITEAGNQSPEIDPVSPVSVTEGDTTTVDITASDPDGDPLTLTAENVPDNMTFTDNGDNTGTITFNPDFVQAGIYDITIIASDGEFEDTLIVTITVDDSGPMPPSFIALDSQFVDEVSTLTFIVRTTDLDNDTTAITAENLPSGATFTDNPDTTGTFSWTTSYDDAGEYTVRFIATDVDAPTLVDTMEVVIVVNNVNQIPRIATSPEPEFPINLFEGDTLIIQVWGLDPDGTIPSLRIDTINSVADYRNMIFIDSGNGAGAMTFTPDYAQGRPSQQNENQYFTAFTVIDAEDSDLTLTSDQFQIFVYDRNGPPVLSLPTTDTSITEGETLTFTVTAYDSDTATVPVIDSPDLPTNATLTGILSNTKTFTFSPDFTQSGFYTITFIADDNDPRGALSDTVLLNVTVIDAGNQSPIFTSGYSDTIVCLVGSPTDIVITAEDPDLNNPITIACDNVVSFAIFVDSGNGVAVYSFTPDASQLDQVYAVTFTVTDALGTFTTEDHHLHVIDFMRGDANGDEELNMLDIMHIINYLYKAGPDPIPMDAADANYDTTINLMDASYLMDYFYRGGPPPPMK